MCLFPAGSIVRYKKSGEQYVIILDPDKGNTMKKESGWVPAYSYIKRSNPAKQTFHRDQAEMEDGRFEGV